MTPRTEMWRLRYRSSMPYRLAGRILWLIVATFTAVAQADYPARNHPYVNDQAGILSSKDAATIRGLFRELERNRGAEAVVLTIQSIQDYGTGDSTIEAFATHLFNAWGLGSQEQNNGVLMLIALKDRKVRIELGADYAQAHDAAMQTVIDRHIVPTFRRGEYSAGIALGARAVVVALGSSDPAAGTKADPGTVEAPPHRVPSRAIHPRGPPASRPRHLFAWLAGAFASLAAAGFGLRRYLRYRDRRCSRCQIQMVRLDEASDDVYMDSGQKLEEVLTSVDYDVWKCPCCNAHTIRAYRGWFSGYKACPACGYRTLEVESETLEQATYTSTGRQRITKACHHCDHHEERIVVLPMETRSEDSSAGFSGSSSGGGGHSAGGGATGSW